jgi:hypothetical protein
MRYAFRSIACFGVLAIALCATNHPATADTPVMPKDSVKKTADADLKFLQDRLSDLVKKQASGAKLLDGQIKPALGASLMLSVYGDALGDAALKADAIKVAEAINKKDFKAAEGLAQKLAVKPGTPGKPGALPKPFKEDLMLAAVMSPFRGSTVGGLGIDKDIKDMTKTTNPAKIDPAAVEMLAVRSAVINAYGFHVPNDKAKTKPENQKEWQKLATAATDLSNQIATEAGKGAKADEKKLKMLLTTLNARCTDCHNKFRDDE